MFNNINKWVALAITICGLFGTLYGGYSWFNNTYASVEVVEILADNVKLNKLNRLNDQAMFDYYRNVSIIDDIDTENVKRAEKKLPRIIPTQAMKENVNRSLRQMNSVERRLNELKKKLGL